MRFLTAIILLAAGAAALAEPPAHIDISKLPSQSQLIDDVVVPVPSEIFGVLDKLGSPNWAEVLRPSKKPVLPPGDPAHTALLLGTVIAEGFVAVEAQNAGEVKTIGLSVLNLAGAIGVKGPVQRRATAITAAADVADWPKVRAELDGALKDVKEAMTEMQSTQLAQLVSLGGWLRGTEALCQVVSSKYSKDGADLLRQPVLLEYFEKKVSQLKPAYKSNAAVSAASKALTEIKPLITLSGAEDISEKTVKEVVALSGKAVAAITANASATKKKK